MRKILTLLLLLFAVPALAAQSVTIVPLPTTGIGSVAVNSGSAASSLIVRAAPTNLYGVYATNLTSTAGFLVVLNQTTVPADGAITPLDCVPLPASGAASINYIPVPRTYSVGLTVVLTSASTCFTKTTGVITGFIMGNAP